MRAAAIDIGTNSIKIVVGQKDSNGVRVLHENVLITRLGESLYSSGRIGADGVKRTLEGICRLVLEAQTAGATLIRAVATSAMRDAANRDEFIRLVREAAGIEIEVIAGADEARLTRSAVTLDPVLGDYHGNQMTVDVGGGSTEFTSDQEAVSIDIGAIRLHERFIRHDPPTADEMQSASAFARGELRNAAPRAGDARIVGVGGSAVNVARILRKVPCEEYAKVHGAAVTQSELRQLIDELKEMPVVERKGLVGLDPERADVILTGAMILEAALDVLDKQDMIVSTRGVRHGLLYEMLEVAS